MYDSIIQPEVNVFMICYFTILQQYCDSIIESDL